MYYDDEIVIVGVGCRFPGADNLTEFWRVLSKGENHVKEIPQERWNVDAFYDADADAPGKTYVRKAGLLDRFDEWDHLLFGINDKEAEVMDPQQRLVLDCVHMALEEGGITRACINGTNSGVYIGVMNDDYKTFVGTDADISANYSVTGTQRSLTSARVSYVYNLQGPAITIDTACSSSLVAINIGSQALREGECDMAICGGANTLLDPNMFVMLSKARMLSPTGQCQTYSKFADGYARGEGCGIVILKRLKDAIKGGNKIRANISTMANQDGHETTPITAPSGQQQAVLLQRIYTRNKIDKLRMQVIEAHGTGTPVGDPVEASALGQFFSDVKSNRNIYIGSVKTNIGHLEAAAGVAGLIKLLLMMEHGTIVPSLMYSKETENPAVQLDKYNFMVPTSLTKWEPVGESRVACVNSFGFGGTNAHAIVIQHGNQTNRRMTKSASAFRLPYIVTISALDSASLKENVQSFYDSMKQNSYCIRSLSTTSTCHRDHRVCRKAFITDSQEMLLRLCEQFIKMPENLETHNSDKKIVFVFCGVGTAWKGMCKTLMNNSYFKSVIMTVDKILQPLIGWSVASKLTGEDDVVTDPILNHIAIFSCQVGLVNLWKSFGVVPEAVLGQSVGEVAAGFAAGHITLETAVNIIYHRSRLLADVTGGGMAFVKNVPINEIETYCKATDGKINVAVYNSPVSCTVTGDKSAIEELKSEMKNFNNGNGTFLDLDVQCAYHSPHVEMISSRLKESLKQINAEPRSKPFLFSTVTGKQISSGLLGTAEYWIDNVTKPVLFYDAVRESHNMTGKKSVFVEIGPNPVLRTHLTDIFIDNGDAISLPSLKKGDELNTLAQAIGTLFENGFDLKWNEIQPPAEEITDIPIYLFKRNKILYRDPKQMLENQGIDNGRFRHMFIDRKPSSSLPIFRASVDDTSTPFVFEHKVRDVVLVPGAFHADIGFEVGKTLFSATPDQLQVGLEFLKSVRLDDKGRLTMEIICSDVNEDKAEFYVKEKGRTVVKGNVLKKKECVMYYEQLDFQQVRYEILRSDYKCFTETEIYQVLKDQGFKYGPSFRIITEALSGKLTALTTLHVSKEVFSCTDKTTLHPCILDGMLQSTALISDEETMNLIQKEQLQFLPVAIQRVELMKPLEEKMIVYTKITKRTILDTAVKLQFDLTLCDKKGCVIAVVNNFTTYSRRKNQSAPDELKYVLNWRPVSFHQVETGKHERVLIIADVQETFPELENESNWIYFRCSLAKKNDSLIETIFDFVTQKWESIEKLDAIAVLFDKNSKELTDTDGPLSVYNKVKADIGLLVALIRFLMTRDVKIPIFFATQNTQCLTGSTQSQMNFIGSEVWGLVRSVQLEFVTCQMTMIDVQPSMKENISVFKDVIQTIPKDFDDIKTELLISNGNVYGAEFSKTALYDSIPELRSSKNYRMNHPSTIRSSNPAVVQEPYLFPQFEMLLSDLKINSRNMVLMKIETIYQHLPVLFPITTESEDQTEHQAVFGIEYTGIEVETGPSKHSMCKGAQTEPEGESSSGQWETVALFPAGMKNYMVVPRSCTVSMKDIQTVYKPGILFNIVLATAIVEQTTTRSKVVIVAEKEMSTLACLLQAMIPGSQSVGLRLSPEQIKDCETLILLAPQEQYLSLILKAKNILYLNDTISCNILKQMVKMDGKTLRVLKLQELFRIDSIPKTLKASVKWLKKNSAKLTHSQLALGLTMEDSKAMSIAETGKNPLPCKVPLSSLFRKARSYLITGGLTGLGWELLVFIAEMGGGTIATLSRRLPSEAKLKEIRKVESRYSCKIVCLQGDVTIFDDVSETIKSLSDNSKTGHLHGVFHGAGVLDSALLLNMEEKHIENVMKVKIQGAMNLHYATIGLNLDYFIVQSSITSIIGAPGQGNYGGANSFLDAFALWRRQNGLAGQSINWGALEVGMAADGNFASMFEKRGFHLLTKSEIRSCFQQALMQNESGVVFTSLDWNLVAKDYIGSQLKRLRLKVANVIEERTTETVDFKSSENQVQFDMIAIKALDANTQQEFITTFVKTLARRIIGSSKEVPLTATFQEIGMDSMSAVTFSNVAFNMTGCRINLSFMMDSANTLEAVANYLSKNLFSSV